MSYIIKTVASTACLIVYLQSTNTTQPVPVAAPSKAYMSAPAEIVSSIPTGDVAVCLL